MKSESSNSGRKIMSAKYTSEIKKYFKDKFRKGDYFTYKE